MNPPINPGSSLPLLAREKLDRYRSRGAFGKPAYQNHVQLKAMLRAKHGDLCANYFARPSLDPDTGELSWTADVPGEARRWRDIPPEQQGKLALQLEVVRSRLLAYIDEMRAQAGGKTGTAASHATQLEQAMRAPAEEFLFFVGEQPIVAFWAFEDEEGRSIDPSELAPRFPSGDHATAGAPPRPGDGGVPPPPVPDPREHPWWRRLWWLWLLLLLALLVLLARGCAPGGRFEIDRAIRGAPAGESRDPEPPGNEQPVARRSPGGSAPGSSAGFAGPGGGSGGSGGSGAGGPDVVVPGQGTDVRRPDPGTSTVPAPDVVPATPPGMSLVGPDPNRPDNPGQPTDPGRPNPPPSPADDPGKPGDAGRPDGTPPGPQAPGEGVKIPSNPQDARKMDFLQGDWKAGSGLADRETGRPLDLSVRFGNDGKGEITLRRQDGSVCKGPVQGSVAGGKLTVDGAQSIPCSDGGTFAPPRIECTARPNGTAPCVGVNRADGQRYGLGMQRQ